MKRRLGPSGTFSETSSEKLTDGFTIYDVPGANLDARHEAYTLLKHPDEAVQASAQRIIDLLTRSIRLMARGDVGVLQAVEVQSGDPEINEPAATLSDQPNAA